MPAADKDLFYRAVSRLEAGEDPQTVAKVLDISYSTVLRWNREYKAAKEQGHLDKLLDIDKLILATAAEGLGLPAEVVQPAVKELTTGIKGLNQLQESLQMTALYLVQQIKSRAASIDHTSELTELTGALCELQNAFFNKNSTQVNVQNNFGNPNQSRYGNMLSDKVVS